MKTILALIMSFILASSAWAAPMPIPPNGEHVAQGIILCSPDLVVYVDIWDIAASREADYPAYKTYSLEESGQPVFALVVNDPPYTEGIEFSLYLDYDLDGAVDAQYRSIGGRLDDAPRPCEVAEKVRK